MQAFPGQGRGGGAGAGEGRARRRGGRAFCVRTGPARARGRGRRGAPRADAGRPFMLAPTACLVERPQGDGRAEVSVGTHGGPGSRPPCRCLPILMAGLRQGARRRLAGGLAGSTSPHRSPPLPIHPLPLLERPSSLRSVRVPRNPCKTLD